MEVRIITECEQWNDFLTEQQYGHLLQSYEWGELNQYLGIPIYRLGALEHGRMIGSLLLTVRSVPIPAPIPKLLPHWLYYLRGPTVEHADSPALAALIRKAEEIARQERAVILRLEPNVAEDDPNMDCWIASYQALGFRTNLYAMYPRRNWVLDIRPDLEHLYANFRKAWRQDIHLAERKGVIVRAAENDTDFDAYYTLLQATCKRDRFFIRSKEYHREMLRQFAGKGDAVLYLAELAGEPIAAKIVIRFGTWCYDMFGATSDNYPDLPKTHLLQYRCLQWAKEHGCIYFDFRAIPEVLEPGEEMWGVYQFKKGFGGFSRLNMPTQDYVYRPFIYSVWCGGVKVRRRLHRIKRKKRVLRSSREKRGA